MKYILLLAITLLVPFAAPVSAQTSDLTVVAIGDSLVEGFCVEQDETFIGLISEWSNVPIINEGIPGDETEDVLARLDQDLFSYNPDIAIVLVGGNDILDGDPREETVANLREIIETIQAEGIEVIFLGAHGEVFEFNYEADYRQLAADTDTHIVDNVLRDVLGRPARMCDPIHPNETGHQIIAESTFPVFQKLINDSFPNEPITGSCVVSGTEFMTGDGVVYDAYAVGGGGSYTFSWEGDENITGSSQSLSTRFNLEGTKDMSVTVSGDTDTAAFACPVVEVMNEPLTAECTVSDEEVFLLESVQYSVTARGGSGTYEYDWTGSEDLSGDQRTVRISYETEGTKTAAVTVTSVPDGETVTADCPTVTTTEPTLVGSCAVELAADEARGEVTIRYTTMISGGDGNYEYDWTTNFNNDPSDDATERELQEAFAFTDSGVKRATAEISSAGQQITLSCSAEIPDPLVVEENRITRASCEVTGRPLETGRSFNWTALLNAGGGEVDYSWSGTDGLSGFNRSETITYETPGLKTGTVAVSGNGFASELSCQLVIGEAGEVDPSSGGGCFIATAAFGSKLIYEVETLRKFRDQYLLTNAPGRAFVDWYYTNGPDWAAQIERSETARTVTRWVLYPVARLADLFV